MSVCSTKINQWVAAVLGLPGGATVSKSPAKGYSIKWNETVIRRLLVKWILGKIYIFII